MKSSEYYKKNKEARDKKNAYQKAYNKKSSSVKKRVELNKENRKRGTYGNGDGLDVSHMGNGRTKLEKASKNRANGTRTAGDRKARGKKK
jgi:hypothetical protein